MIRLCDIRKTYKTRHGSVEVLNGISLTVPDHTLVMLLGESGSGKSTLCNILGLLDTPTAGEYFLDDTPIHTLSQKERTDMRREKVSFVFQSFNLIPTMTAWENIELPLGYRHFSKSERDARVETVLRSVGLIGRADHYPSELSGGEQQRIAIARALASDAKVILADEPTGNLDTENGKIVIDLLKKLVKDENYCVIVVTHDPGIAAQADVVYKMQDGRLAVEC